MSGGCTSNVRACLGTRCVASRHLKVHNGMLNVVSFQTAPLQAISNAYARLTAKHHPGRWQRQLRS